MINQKSLIYCGISSGIALLMPTPAEADDIIPSKTTVEEKEKWMGNFHFWTEPKNFYIDDFRDPIDGLLSKKLTAF
ncbi:hypothetical protein EV44_g0259 [Erysiphe necator]|uniref:Uncharacterized protein n=1 Tax=Uncinula necator TaxID=52586 RepID=A0A0B1PAF9_UNCNE|nr:hypothetical protein EV44_g0259 [Erysiphe necator]